MEGMQYGGAGGGRKGGSNGGGRKRPGEDLQREVLQRRRRERSDLIAQIRREFTLLMRRGFIRDNARSALLMNYDADDVAAALAGAPAHLG